MTRGTFHGRVKEPKFTCLSPGAEQGNVCNYPWWTMFIRLGTLWECPRCHKLAILEIIEASGWHCKSWTSYIKPAVTVNRNWNQP